MFVASNLSVALRNALAGVDTATRLVGTYVSNDGIVATVDVGGGRIPVDFCGYTPEINETVWVLFVNGTATLIGPSAMKPGVGTISGAPAGGLVNVVTDAGTLSLPYASNLTLSNGQAVRLGGWNNGGFVFAIVSTTPVAPIAPSAPVAASRGATTTFTAKQAGSYRSGNGWWTPQVWASDNNTGAWFYGTKIRDTIPNSAAIDSIYIYISATQIIGWPPNFGTHANGTRPAGNVTVSSQTAIAVVNGWIKLPNSFGTYLRSNVGGIGIASGGYSIFRSLAQNATSGALKIKWHT